MKFVCNYCGKLHETDIINFNLIDESERSLGIEKTYTGGTYLKCDCENILTFSFDLYLYPKDFINFTETRNNNCEIIEEPNYELLINK